MILESGDGPHPGPLPSVGEGGREAQAEFFSALPDAALVTTRSDVIVAANSAALTMFGLAEPPAGRPIRALIPLPDVLPEVQPGVWGWQMALHQPDRAEIELRVLRTLLRREGAPLQHLYVLHDVSALADVSRMREQLLYNLAHELRGPLGVLENVIDILRSSYADLTMAEMERLLDSGRRTAARLHDVMEDLLSAGSIQTGRFAVYRRPVSVAQLLDEAIEAEAAITEERGQPVKVELVDPALTVLADQRYAVRVLTNLLSNASKYAPAGEPILIRAFRADGCARIVVEDHGPGIPTEQQAGLFERFYRARSASEAPGIGLGLAIARGIVEAHGGSMGVDSGPNRGTRVWFTLPLAGEAEEI